MVKDILKPCDVVRTERRRSPRRRLREPTEVALRTTEMGAGWHGQASLLNISPEGIACRLTPADGAKLTIGQPLRVTLDLGSPPVAFDLAARVINITVGGTGDRLIVGLEFIADNSVDVNRQRLREACQPQSSPRPKIRA